jgi:ubiquinone/menaquinone biosynthesis C-methylase UbiE
MSNLHYRITASFWLTSRLRRRIEDPERVLRKLWVSKEYQILDYGCGNGFYTIPAARLASEGRVYALDIQPLAVKDIEKSKEKHGLKNIVATLSDSNRINLPDASIDLIILSRVLYYIENRSEALQEMNRVLKTSGHLWAQQGRRHMTGEEIERTVTEEGFFALEERIEGGFKFRKG